MGKPALPNLSLLLGSPEAAPRAHRFVAVAAGSDESVLIEGEAGCGRELVARAIHLAGDRAAGRYLALEAKEIMFECLLPPDLCSEALGGAERWFRGASWPGSSGETST